MARVRPSVEPVLTWKDARGYRLSDRVWNVGEATAGQIDALLQDAIANGTGSLRLARMLEQFLRPGMQLPTTTAPYGTTASYNAMRLARSEITRAHSIAAHAAAMQNPFVNREYYHLSPAHNSDPGDPCEIFAADSAANDGYPKGQCPLPMVDTHPHCMCYTTSGVIPMSEAITQIRAQSGFEESVGIWVEPQQSTLLKMAIYGIAAAFFRRIFGKQPETDGITEVANTGDFLIDATPSG